ncbi:hypothetical protein MMC13_000033 [Lambiella insularis]|nr:hypothetical protein [Lambiella insularis]
MDGQLTMATMLFMRYREMLELVRRIVTNLGYRSFAIVHGLFLVTFTLRSFVVNRKRQSLDAAVSKNSAEFAPDHLLQPLLFPCRTSHTRLFPKKHSFSYSYLFVGVPVGWVGSAGSMISVGTEDFSSKGYGTSKAWFRVNASDHLDRGNAHLGLRGKLRVYLESQGEPIEQFPYAYLVTAPMFFGYSFNPVSFWYLYSKEMQLKAMILEVNNTFDERRMYLLKGSADMCEASPTVGEALQMEEKTSNPPTSHGSGKFTDAWTKDFHVSPFNSRKGSYALSAYDPFSVFQCQERPINNTITLTSSKGHPKLVARVFSTEPAIAPMSMSTWTKTRFLASWWWVGFVTFPRIVREAGKLFFRRKLHVWFRPEVLNDSIGRRETVRERIIEDSFRSFLRARVEQSSVNTSLKYIASGSDCVREGMLHPASNTVAKEKPNPDTFELKVLTPLFYSTVVRYAHISEFLSSEMLHCDDKQRTFWTSDPEKLLQLLSEKLEYEAVQDTGQANQQIPIQWSALRLLRRSPPARVSLTRPHTPAPRTSTPYDIRSFRLSALDEFVLQHCDFRKARAYRRAVTTLLLSDYIVFGIPEVIDALDLCVRLLLCYLCVDKLVDWWQSFFSPCFFMQKADVLLFCNAIHIWWLLKVWL